MANRVGFVNTAAGELGKFVLRSQVLALYRQFLRTTRPLPPTQKGVRGLAVRVLSVALCVCRRAALCAASGTCGSHSR
jgi:hypothetical protein